MARRNRKKKQTNLLDELRSSLSKVDKRLFLDKWERLPLFHRRALMILCPLLLILLLVPVSDDEYQADTANTIVNKPERKEVAVDITDLSSVGESKQVVLKSDDWNEYSVKSGDTLAKVFRANSLLMSDLNALVKIEGLDKPLSKIKAGQLIRYKLTANGDLDILQLEKNNKAVMFFRLSDGGFGRSK